MRPRLWTALALAITLWALAGCSSTPAHTPTPAPTLEPGSVLLTRNGDGHVSFGKSRCADIDEAAYFTRLVLPASGAVCPTN